MSEKKGCSTGENGEGMEENSLTGTIQLTQHNAKKSMISGLKRDGYTVCQNLAYLSRTAVLLESLLNR